MSEKRLDYPRTITPQETGFWCGPASVQIVLASRGITVAESVLARELGTTTSGTDWIGQITAVLRNRLPDGKWITVEMPHDPPAASQIETLWSNLVRSIDAGFGAVVNIVSPPSNRPTAVAPSTISPNYGRGTIYHYVAAMGYGGTGNGRRIWIADPGFAPFGYWLSLAKLASLIPPKGYSVATATPPAKPAPSRPATPKGMSAEVLSKAMGGSLSIDRYRELLPHFITGMRAAQITNVNRAAMWCAQIGHESLGLRYMEEIASGDAYEGRRDLGNVYPGDGRRFKGSGPIQLTGRHNFTQFSRWAAHQGHTDDPNLFVNRPELVRTNPTYGFLAAAWYWVVARPRLNDMADARDLIGATKAINGGTNGLTDRSNRWNLCLALGTSLLPAPDTGGLTMADINDITDRLDLILDQLGPKHPDWGEESSFGLTSEGLERTQRDGQIAFFHDVLTRLNRIEARLDGGNK